MASANVEDARSGCCGISGSYGFKKEKYDVAASVGSDLFKAVKDSAARVLRHRVRHRRLQISHHTKLPSMHPISWLRKLVK